MSLTKKTHLPFEKPIELLEKQLEALSHTAQASNLDVSAEIKQLEDKIRKTRGEIYAKLGPWDRVQLSRHPQRPHSLDYIGSIFTDFEELHGDRAFRDDAAIVGGTAWLGKHAVMVIGHQKGRNTKENIARNFGYPHPEGYRKALRLMRMAEKFSLPVITLVDTPGAYPGVGSEERHVAEAIAVNIREMSTLRVPIITAIIGEGGSGGALGLAIADKLLMMENAYYSVITPEGCAAILWKDRKFAKEATENLRITAQELMKLGIIDEIISEPVGGAHVDAEAAAKTLKTALEENLATLRKKSITALLEERYQKYRKIGQVIEG